MAIYS